MRSRSRTWLPTSSGVPSGSICYVSWPQHHARDFRHAYDPWRASSSSPSIGSSVHTGQEGAQQATDRRSQAAAFLRVPAGYVLKDTHTVENQPWRLRRWIEMAYQAIGVTPEPLVARSAA